MKKWNIEFSESKEGNSNSFNIEFYDVSEFTTQEFEISDEIIEEILILAQQKENYNLLHNIRFLRNFNGEDYTNKNVIVILGTTILEQKFGMLYLKILDKSFKLVALWPKEFILQFSDDNKLLINFLSDIVNEPDSFYDISVILP
ncbi:MAG: hypothetical protein ACTSQO_07625 [Candidatus Helarchaeota archaeon]